MSQTRLADDADVDTAVRNRSSYAGDLPRQDADIGHTLLGVRHESGQCTPVEAHEDDRR